MDITNQTSESRPHQLPFTGVAPDKRKTQFTKPLFNKMDSDDFGDFYEKKKLILGLQNHLLLIVACMLFFGFVGGYFLYLFQSTYEAESIVLFQKEEGVSKNLEGGFTITNLSLSTVLDMIKLPVNLEAVKKSLGLNLSTDQLSSMIKVPAPKNESNLIHIVVQTKTPNLSVDIANSLAKIAVKSSQEFSQKQFKTALDGYEGQQASLRQQLSEDMKQIEEFKIANQYYDMQPQDSSFLAKVEEARKQKNTADLEYNGLLVEYENLKEEWSHLPNYLPTTIESKDNPLQQRIGILHATLAELKSKYTKDNPKLLQTENELKELLERNQGQPTDQVGGRSLQNSDTRSLLELELLHLQAKVLSAQKVKEDVGNLLNSLEAQLTKLPVQQMAFVKLYQAKDFTEEQLKEVTKAVDGARLMVNVPKGSMEVYHLALDARPWKSGFIVDLIPIFGVLFGLVAGAAVGLIFEITDRHFRTAKQIEMAYSIPCIGSIPEIKGLRSENLYTKMLFFVRNFVDQLDKIMKQLPHGHAMIVTVTSSLKNEGKTMVAGLAAEYYAKLGNKVLLISMDPDANESVETSKSSFLDCLEGRASIKEAIIEGNHDSIILSKRESTLKELFKSKKADSLWNELRAEYPLIFIDAPGVIEEDYVSNLTDISNIVLFVIGSSQVVKSTIDESLNILEGAHSRPNGIILNRIHTVYISDERVLFETQRARKGFLKKLFFWNS